MSSPLQYLQQRQQQAAFQDVRLLKQVQQPHHQQLGISRPLQYLKQQHQSLALSY
jgi:hypothetical protein